MADFPWGPSLRDHDLDRRVLEVFQKFPHEATSWKVGQRTMVAMLVDKVSQDWIHGSLCSLHHRIGLHWEGLLTADASVHVPGLNHCYPLVCTGEKIFIAGIPRSVSDDGLTLELQRGGTVVHYPEVASELHWNMLHLFSGGFSGWSQAAEWLETAEVGFVVDRQVFLDWDPSVVKTCAMNHTALVVKAPLEPSPDLVTPKKIIVEGSISDFTLLHAVRMPFNLVETLSPPCVSWSKGGTGGGLDSSHGFALLESVEMIFAIQPVAAIFECADEIKSHHHFHVFGALMTQLGYKLAWEQIMPYHYLSNHYRNRWLALWVRYDIPATEVSTLLLMVPPIVRWTDDRYSFTLPREIQVQLKLSPDHFLLYGELQLLPPGKRAKVNPSVTALQVIRARIPLPQEPLATLCSSYTQQL